MVILYGADLSSPSNKVRFVLHALNLTYDYKRISIREGQNRTPEFLKLHPAGKVPVIDDNGFVLFESNAIIKYLAQKNNSSLYPLDLEQKSLIDQWIDFISMHVNGALEKILYNRVFAPVIGVPADERAIQEGEKLFHRFLPVVDNQTGCHPYLVRSGMTLADFCLLAALDPVEAGGLSLESYPKVKAWREKMQAQEFYTRCHGSYVEALQKFRKPS